MHTHYDILGMCCDGNSRISDSLFLRRGTLQATFGHIRAIAPRSNWKQNGKGKVPTMSRWFWWHTVLVPSGQTWQWRIVPSKPPLKHGISHCHVCWPEGISFAALEDPSFMVKTVPADGFSSPQLPRAQFWFLNTQFMEVWGTVDRCVGLVSMSNLAKIDGKHIHSSSQFIDDR